MVDPTSLPEAQSKCLRQYRLYGAIARSRQHGAAFIYLGIFAMFAFFGIVAIAVDIGKLRSSKAQLSTAADASACAGALAIVSGDTSDAEAAAIDVSGDNLCQGTPVALVGGQDIEYGLYRVNTHIYTPLGSTEASGNTVDESECNACKTTPRRTAARGNQISVSWLTVFHNNNPGAPSGKDVVASATAFVRGGPRAGGLIGLEWVDMNGNTYTDSYNTEPYDPLNRRENGTVMSNGTIHLNGTPDIYGDARPGMDSSVELIGQAGVHGWTAPLDEPLVFPPASVPAGTPNSGQIRLRAGETRTLSPGTYWFTSIDLKGNSTLIIQPNVKVYVTGAIDFSGGSVVNPGPAAAFEIFQVGGAMVDLGGGSVLKAHVYAPESNTRYHGTNSGGFYGWIVGRTLDIKGNSALHYDETLPNDEGPFRTVLVK